MLFLYLSISLSFQSKHYNLKDICIVLEFLKDKYVPYFTHLNHYFMK
jgi:hypothetical protein